MQLQPVQVLEDGASDERGEHARLSSFVGAIAIGDLVKTTLGPKGMDKILLSMGGGPVQVTNDGATILKSIMVDNAAAKVLVELSKVQDNEVGDGTTSVCVLAAEMLRQAEQLVNQHLHPQVIVAGFREAAVVARATLEKNAMDIGSDEAAMREAMTKIAKTTLSSKILDNYRDLFAQIAVDAVMRLGDDNDLSHIQMIKKSGGRVPDSYLESGFVLNKKLGVGQPRRIEKPKILIANTPMDTDKIKIHSARVRVGSSGAVAAIEAAEREKMKSKVNKILAHDVNCFINRQLIYNYPEQLFTDAGVVSIEHADFDGVDRLAKVLGGEITSTFDHPELVKYGYCDLIEEIMVGEDKMLRFSGTAVGQACTIILRGPGQQLLDEAERSLHDALAVLVTFKKATRCVLGGGASEMAMAGAVEEAAKKVPGKKAIAMDAVAKALRAMPTIIADNAGYDSADLVGKLRAEHASGNHKAGLDMVHGTVGNVDELGIYEPFALKSQVVASAAEAAEMIVRVDDIIRRAPRQRGQ